MPAMSLRRSLRARPVRDAPTVIESNASTRSTRQSCSTQSLPSVTVVRAPSEPSDGNNRSIHLTVRMPSNKLREATSGNSRSAASRRSHNVFTDNPIVTGPRTSRSRRKLVEVETSDEEEENLEDQEEDEVDDDDAPGEEEDDDEDADGDVDMDDAPPQPPVSRRQAKAAVASAARSKPTKSVEAKEMELEEEDEEDEEEEEEEEELSELADSDADGEPDDQDEGATMNLNEGEEPDEEDDDEELDSDGETPDMSKLTKRQRGSLGNDFLQLPMEPQIKKHLTAEERAMRRAEMARRRKNLSEKRNEEEKMDTINRLLRKQAPKRRGRIPAAEAAENAAADQETAAEYEPVDTTMARWISGREGSRVAIPEDWVGTPAGRIFGGTPRKLVEEV
ncbi:PAPA-1-like conserved region-domain-containing protein [Aspergillus unguis]